MIFQFANPKPYNQRVDFRVIKIDPPGGCHTAIQVTVMNNDPCRLLSPAAEAEKNTVSTPVRGHVGGDIRQSQDDGGKVRTTPKR